MKNSCFAICLAIWIISPIYSYAQELWNPDGDGNVFTYNDANPVLNGKGVGAIVNIRGDGTYDAALVRSGMFHAHHFQASSGFFIGSPETNGSQIIDGSGNIFATGIGIGTSTPGGKLDINAGSQYAIRTNTTSRYIIEVKNSNDVGGGWWLVNDPGGSFAIHENGIGDQLTVKEGGNVGIGTTTPDSKLTVKGAIHSQEVKVDLNGSVAPDYVFDKNYPLTSLEELKSYIEQNKHLPEIPSAKEMEEEGIDLKEMNLLLLKKVEELTLYIIELKKENHFSVESLQKQIDQLNNK